MHKYEMDPTRTIGATEPTPDAGQTDGQTDRRSETDTPPTTSLCRGYNKANKCALLLKCNELFKLYTAFCITNVNECEYLPFNKVNLCEYSLYNKVYIYIWYEKLQHMKLLVFGVHTRLMKSNGNDNEWINLVTQKHKTWTSEKENILFLALFQGRRQMDKISVAYFTKEINLHLSKLKVTIFHKIAHRALRRWDGQWQMLTISQHWSTATINLSQHLRLG